MKFLLPIMILALFSFNANAETFDIKFYQKDGSVKQYSIDDIKEMTFENASEFLNMRIYREGKPSTWAAANLKKMEFTELIINTPLLQLYYYSSQIIIPIAEIDSILFIYDYPTEPESIVIGNQEWMLHNLNVTEYRNGERITRVIEPNDWGEQKTEAWCYYDNMYQYDPEYGKLYNWYAINDERELAPEGWRIPNDEEWKELEIALGMLSEQADSMGMRGAGVGSKLKEEGNEHWAWKNEDATNESGFTALPGGRRLSGTGDFDGLTSRGYWWTSSEYDYSKAIYRTLLSSDNRVGRIYLHKGVGMSVRCLKGDRPVISLFAPLSAHTGEEIAISGKYFGDMQGESIVYFDDIAVDDYLSWSDSLIKLKIPDNAESGYIWLDKNGIKSKGKFLYIKLDKYPAIRIDNQLWMQINLEVTHYRNGDEIPYVEDPEEWASLTTGAWCYYNNDPETGEIYGKLYNWYAVNDPRGLAPDGWKIASDKDWNELVDSLKSEIGNKLKAKGTEHWPAPNENATNETGFTALPGGMRNAINGNYEQINSFAYWWTSTDINDDYSILRRIAHNFSFLDRFADNKRNGYSVRCLREK